MPTYVAQVMGGQESYVACLVNKIKPCSIDSCFIPSFEFMRKYGGEWRRVTDVLFPGYVFIVSNDIERASAQLRSVPAFTRILGASGGLFFPLDDEEVAWLNALVATPDYVVPMSTGVIVGDRVTIVSGALKGREALISKIDRHKRLAYLDLHILGRDKAVKVGLEVVKKVPASQGSLR